MAALTAGKHLNMYSTQDLTTVEGRKMLIDTYLWNDHTTLVAELFEGVENLHPEIGSWFEVKQGLDLMLAKEAVVLELGVHAWLGCPRNREITEYLEYLTS